MKKIIFGILSLLLAATATFYVLDHQQMKQGKPVHFSTWGKKYTPVENPTSVHYLQAISYGHVEEIDFGQSKSYVLQTLEEQQSFQTRFLEANDLTNLLTYDENFYKNNTVIITMFWANALVNPTEYSLTNYEFNNKQLSLEITYTPTPDMAYGQAMTPFYQVLTLTKQDIDSNNILVTFK